MSPSHVGFAELQFEVGPQDLAPALGSGDVPALATPRLIAWLEAASMAAVAQRLEPGQTSVGTRVAVDHLAPVGTGSAVTVWARVALSDGKVVEFDCGARTSGQDATSLTLATGLITRAIVDRDRFASRIG